MHRIAIRHDQVSVGRYFALSFQRTLRIPDDGRTYPLPPGLGRFPLRWVRRHRHRVPGEWQKRGGVFLPMYQREALWLAFAGAHWHPSALKVGVGGINAVSGAPWDEELRSDPQNYLVTPDQPWLDGINAGSGLIRQFVALPLGRGATVEGQITGREEEGGIQLAIISAKPARFPDEPPDLPAYTEAPYVMDLAPSAPGMGLGAGGRMEQRIYPDPYGSDTWDRTSITTVHVHIATTEMWRFITGEAPPPTPISAKMYSDFGLPWFRLYDEQKGDLAPSETLAAVKSLGELDGAATESGGGESLSLTSEQVIGLGG